MNKLYLKSSEDMSEIPDDSIRLVVTSPPYFNVKDYGMDEQIGKSSHTYEHYIESMLPVWRECLRILKPNGKLCINSPVMPMPKKVYSTHYNRDILNINNDIEASILKNMPFYRFSQVIWDKGSTDQLMMGSYPYPPNFYFLNTIEFINIFVKDGQPEKLEKSFKEKSRLSKQEWRDYISTIWKFRPELNRRHPAPFPVELPRRLIKMFSFKDDIIVDPFMGSASTAEAALREGRQYIGYEINPEYIRMSEQRLNEVKANPAPPSGNGELSSYDQKKMRLLQKLLRPEYADENTLNEKIRQGQSLDAILNELNNDN